MHQSAHASSGVGFLPAMYSFSGPTSLPQFDFGTPRTSDDLQKSRVSNRYVGNICRRDFTCDGGLNTLNSCGVVDMLTVTAAGRCDAFGRTGGELMMSKWHDPSKGQYVGYAHMRATVFKSFSPQGMQCQKEEVNDGGGSGLYRELM